MVRIYLTTPYEIHISSKVLPISNRIIAYILNICKFRHVTKWDLSIAYFYIYIQSADIVFKCIAFLCPLALIHEKGQ